MSPLIPARTAGDSRVQCRGTPLEEIAVLATSPKAGESFVLPEGLAVAADEANPPPVIYEEGPSQPRPVRYWPDGTQVTLDIEAALDRIVATVKRVQAKRREAL